MMGSRDKNSTNVRFGQGGIPDMKSGQIFILGVPKEEFLPQIDLKSLDKLNKGYDNFYANTTSITNTWYGGRDIAYIFFLV